MFEHEGVGRIPWRSKRTVGDINRLNERGRETGSDEDLPRIGATPETGEPSLDQMTMEERVTAMTAFLRTLPEIQVMVHTMSKPPSTLPMRDLTGAGLRAEIMGSGKKEWRADPFHYLAIAAEFRARQELERAQQELE